MSRRVKIWLIALGAFDLLCWALAAKASVDYHAGSNGPRVMTIGNLLGWLVSIVLLIVWVSILVTWYRTKHGLRPGPGGSRFLERRR